MTVLEMHAHSPPTSPRHRNLPSLLHPLHTQTQTLAARGLEEHVQVSLIFAIRQFHVIYCFTLVYVLDFEEFRIHDMDS